MILFRWQASFSLDNNQAGIIIPLAVFLLLYHEEKGFHKMGDSTSNIYNC